MQTTKLFVAFVCAITLAALAACGKSPTAPEPVVQGPYSLSFKYVSPFVPSAPAALLFYRPVGSNFKPTGSAVECKPVVWDSSTNTGTCKTDAVVWPGRYAVYAIQREAGQPFDPNCGGFQGRYISVNGSEYIVHSITECTNENGFFVLNQDGSIGRAW